MEKWIFRMFLAGCATVLLLSGCATPANLTLLKDMDYDHPYGAPPVPELKIQRGDRLSVQVLSENPLLAAPFTDEAASAERASAGADGYAVDMQGAIEFPVLGRVAVEGLTLRECEQLIARQIRERGYIREPVVKASLENFSITVLGSTGNSVIPVTEDSINLLQVLARSGGVDYTAQIRDVMVVRTEGGTQMAYSVDLQSRSLFDSPAFYLKQNDIVYVKPKGSSLNKTGETILSFVQSTLSLGWILSNVILWFR